MKIDLSEKVAIVTGAAGGIGRKTVEAFLEAGAAVIAVDKSEKVIELESSSSRVAIVQGEIAKPITAKNAVSIANEKFGGLDILVNNAGRSFPKPFLEISERDWDEVMADNVKGMFLHMQEAVPSMIARGGGSIVNVSSISGIDGIANLVAYCSSKGAVNMPTKSSAIELARHHIRVNAVAPGIIETPILDNLAPNGRQSLIDLGAQEPIGRVGQPEEIANVILFLASDASGFMTGSIVAADGGYTAK